MIYVKCKNLNELGCNKELIESIGHRTLHLSNNELLAVSSLDAHRESINGQRYVVASGEDGFDSWAFRDNSFTENINGAQASNGFEFHVREDSVVIDPDILAIFPIYYYLSSTALIVSSTLETFKYLGFKIDLVGVVEFSHFGYFVGKRTFFRDVCRVRAGESIHIDTKKYTASAKETSTLWSDSGRPLDSTTVSDLAEHICSSVNSNNASMLMMSGGWDSRTILAAMLAGGAKNSLLYFHGDAESREHAIVTAIAKSEKVELVSNPIGKSMFEAEVLANDYAHFPNIFFPHWHGAGEYASKNGIDRVLSGVIGEVLGGHYGPPMALSGAPKALALAGYIAFPKLTEKVLPYFAKHNESPAAFDILKIGTINKPWYFSTETWSEIEETLSPEINSDINQELERLRRRGVSSNEMLIEAFITEHRAAQYICAQSLSLRHSKVKIALPFATRELLSLSTKINFGDKVHNKLNQKIIQKLAPSLLNYPMAATILPASAPIFAQEASRAGRMGYERVMWGMHRIMPNIFALPRLGWVNFEFAKEEGALDEFVDGLKSELWDIPSIKRFCGSYNEHSYHPLVCMLTILLTIEKTCAPPTQKP
jgi:asparagine synthetase B (glutamine-hydrolysing)